MHSQSYCAGSEHMIGGSGTRKIAMKEPKQQAIVRFQTIFFLIMHTVRKQDPISKIKGSTKSKK